MPSVRRRVCKADKGITAPILFCAAHAAVACAALLLSGCGTPGAPQPPSLKLPEPVTDLVAVRAGDQVTLSWTTPHKTTDHLLVQGSVVVSICRREPLTQTCAKVGRASSSPHAQGEFRDVLPVTLSQGPARELIYSVELLGPKDRSAGFSNAAVVLAGQAPGPLSGLSVEVRADGVAFHWDHENNSEKPTSVRLHRRLLTPPQNREKQKGSPAESESEPLLRDLLAPPPDQGQHPGALDTSVQFGHSYEYTAQRVIEVTLNGPDGNRTFELDGPLSPPIKVDVIDSFPPSIPQELAAVFVPERHSIDLSWQPDTESDLAGYIVYRSLDGGEWNRVSGSTPITGPAYRDVTIETGHTYRYAISAIDQTGHESKRSAEVSESTSTE